MMFWQGAFTLFIMLGLSLVLCILAKREEGIVRTVGYTLAASLILLCILFIVTDIHTGEGSLFLPKSGPHLLSQTKTVR